VKRKLILAVIVTALLGAQSGAAFAAAPIEPRLPEGETISADFVKVLATIPKAEQQDFLNTYYEYKTESTSVVVPLSMAKAKASFGPTALAALGTTCWVGTYTGNAKAPLGNVTRSFGHKMDWCNSGGRLSSIRIHSQWGKASWGYAYGGVRSSIVNTYGNIARSVVQYNFSFIYDGSYDGKCLRGTGDLGGGTTSALSCAAY
jgi:hypothetical protein